MKRVFLFALMFVLVGCAPAASSVAQPSATAPAIALATATATTASTSTPLATPTDTPSPIPTATRTPTLTATPLPTPSGVTFKFDDGVPQSQRDTIIQGLAMARSYLGDSRPMTVIAYADLNAQMDEIARVRGVPRTSLTRQLQLLQTDRPFGSADLLAFPMSKTWQSRAKEVNLQYAVHEYFHAVEAFLTNTDPFNYVVAEWLYEGTADFASYHVLAKYGYYNLDDVYKGRLERTRGVVSPLSTMEVQRVAEREMINTPYYFGYLADEMLAKMAGEDAVLRKFWENYPKYPGWQLAFQATFGISLDEFYKRFEETRRAQFPPFCGTQGEYIAPGTSDPFTLKFVKQVAPGVLTYPEFSFTSNSPAPVAYVFCATGYNLTTVTDIRPTYQFPPGYAGWVSCGGNCVVVYMPQKITASTFTFTIDLPDKRHAEAQFQHSILPAVTPKP